MLSSWHSRHERLLRAPSAGEGNTVTPEKKKQLQWGEKNNYNEKPSCHQTHQNVKSLVNQFGKVHTGAKRELGSALNHRVGSCSSTQMAWVQIKLCTWRVPGTAVNIQGAHYSPVMRTTLNPERTAFSSKAVSPSLPPSLFTGQGNTFKLILLG